MPLAVIDVNNILTDDTVMFVLSLDKEQQRVRKETASVIMEAEKLSQEVRHLQNEVDKLREVTSHIH